MFCMEVFGPLIFFYFSHGIQRLWSLFKQMRNSIFTNERENNIFSIILLFNFACW